MVVDDQVASRERMPRRARVDQEGLMMRRKIKKDVSRKSFDASCTVIIFNKKDMV